MNTILHKFTNMFTKAYFHLVNYGLLYGWGIFMTLILLMAFASCSTKKYVPVETKTITNYVDSVRHIEVLDTSYISLPKETIKDYCSSIDTLTLENTYSKAICWLSDSLNILQGTLTNKDTKLPVISKNIETVKVEYRDSIQIKEVPVEVVTEKPYVPRLVLWYIIASGAYFIFYFVKFVRNFKP